jgi:hypothetical protein
MANRKGVNSFNILFISVFLPTVLAIKQLWLAWPFAMIGSLIAMFVFLQHYPKLMAYKRIYLEAQLIGVFLGLIILIFPDSDVKFLGVLLWFIWVLFRIVITKGSNLLEELSN